ncbi:hypothetical protein [Sporomusa aerivorans]|uniref:hypothetical protein n=1 Tax=Sporomusa aerivorans TaxID=204936 RepID=UPI00352A62EB
MLQLLVHSNNNYSANVLHSGMKRSGRFRPLAAHNIVKQQRRYLKQALLEAIARNRWQREMQTALAVEHCHLAIEALVKEFIEKETECLGLYASNILQGKTKVANCLFQEFLNPLALATLLENMKHSIQLELKECFGAVSVDIAAFQYSAADSAVISQMVSSVDECRNTLLIAEIAAEAGDQTWEKALSKIVLNPSIRKILNKIKLGTIALSIVGCDHKLLVEQYRLQLEQELAGILFNVTHRVKLLMRNKAAQVFYEMYDSIYGSYFTSLEHTVKINGFYKTRTVPRERVNLQAI